MRKIKHDVLRLQETDISSVSPLLPPSPCHTRYGRCILPMPHCLTASLPHCLTASLRCPVGGVECASAAPLSWHCALRRHLCDGAAPTVDHGWSTAQSEFADETCSAESAQAGLWWL